MCGNYTGEFGEDSMKDVVEIDGRAFKLVFTVSFEHQTEGRVKEWGATVVKALSEVSRLDWQFFGLSDACCFRLPVDDAGPHSEKLLMFVIERCVQTPRSVMGDDAWVARAMFSEIYDEYIAALDVPRESALTAEKSEKQIEEGVKNIVALISKEEVRRLRFSRYIMSGFDPFIDQHAISHANAAAD